MTTKSAKQAQRRLQRQGVTISVWHGGLEIHWQQGAMTPRILTYLRTRRVDLVAALATKQGA